MKVKARQPVEGVRTIRSLATSQSFFPPEAWILNTTPGNGQFYGGPELPLSFKTVVKWHDMILHGREWFTSLHHRL